MTPANFSAWMRDMGYTFKDAAEALGLSERAVYRYAEGSRKIPGPVILLTQRLAAEARQA